MIQLFIHAYNYINKPPTLFDIKHEVIAIAETRHCACVFTMYIYIYREREFNVIKHKYCIMRKISFNGQKKKSLNNHSL